MRHCEPKAKQSSDFADVPRLECFVPLRLRLAVLAMMRKTCVSAPVVYGAGYADFAFSLSAKPKGTECQTAPRLGLPPCGGEPSCDRGLAPAGAPSRRSSAALHRLLVPGSALPGTRPPLSRLSEPVPVQRAPLRAFVMPPGRGPGASRVFACEAKPRAPHPIPPSDAS